MSSYSIIDPTLQRIVIGTVLIGLSASLVGVFSFLRKKSLIGDAISHAILPGIAVAYLFIETKNPVALLIGAVIAGWLATIVMGGLQRTTKLKEDSIIAIVLSAFFALGLVLLSWIQGHSNGSQSGLSDFLFGKVAALTNQDVYLFTLVGIALLLIIGIKKRLFYYIAFDRDYMATRGFSVRWNESIISTCSIFAIAIGIQAVGVVLMSALLIIPVASARMLTYRLGTLMLLTGIFGVVSALGGSYLSTLSANMPTGPWIIMVLAGIALLSFFIGKLRSKTNQKAKLG